jgi:hypothetical protein
MSQYFKKAKSILLLCCTIVLLSFVNAFAQSKATQKLAQRYEINAKRVGVDVSSEDALPRSREFLRIDSTYYVGWMFEGIYKFNHAADYLGFKNATVPLERALYLLERDYTKELSTRSPEIQLYFPAYAYQIDYTRTAYCLMTCYANTEDPEKVMTLMHRVLKWKFQRDLYMDAYNYLGWTTHRYRFYTSAKYSFLKNTIDANEKLAMSYLDSGLAKIERDKKFNAHIFQPGYERLDKMGVYHYKCILYSYAFNIDSAEHYFDLMRVGGVLPHNNYANFKSICGNFREAEKEYTIASTIDAGDKRLQEWAYYLSILDIYKAKPKDGIQLAQDMISGFGSTPGFGWYNIALARSFLYDGQIEESEKYVEKAASFKELHIGTTLGQSHYDFSIQLLKLMNNEQRFAMQRFENKNWWYKPTILGNMAQLVAERFLQQYLIINQFAQNPERDRVIYKLFSTESTVSWDEVWYLMKDFSTTFFINRFEKELKENNRKPVTKYFKLFIAKLKIGQGKYTEAKKILNEILQDPNTDAEYEKLFAARCFQSFAACAEKEKEQNTLNEWTYRMYKTYPQLVPFCNLTVNMQLITSGASDIQLIARLKDCNINFSNQSSIKTYISFTTKGGKKNIDYKVIDAQGNEIIAPQHFSYKLSNDGAIELAYRLFGIGGTVKEAGHK